VVILRKMEDEGRTGGPRLFGKQKPIKLGWLQLLLLPPLIFNMVTIAQLVEVRDCESRYVSVRCRLDTLDFFVPYLTHRLVFLKNTKWWL